MTTLLHTTDELHARARRGPRAVVMTMGALHEGHATLIRAARRLADASAGALAGTVPRSAPGGPVRRPAGSLNGPSHQGAAGSPGGGVGGAATGRGEVVVTVFVNPLQFGAGEDLDRYPRTLDADLALAAEAGADVVFAPAAAEVYPGGHPRVTIAAGPMGERYEGASRPGHFDGMLTVVAKLLNLTRPDVALFGQKDAQQLALVRCMVRDLNFPVDIVAVPTVREADGLALSSRNRFLSAAERDTALALSRALFAGRDRHAAQEALRARARLTRTSPERVRALSALGEARAAADARAVAEAVSGGPEGASGALKAPGEAVLGAARQVLDRAAAGRPPLVLDYLALVDPADFTPVGAGHVGEAVLAVAAKVGSTRLIDNLPLTFGPQGAVS